MGLADNAERAANAAKTPSYSALPKKTQQVVPATAAKQYAAKQTAMPTKITPKAPVKATPPNKIYGTPSKTTPYVPPPITSTGSVEKQILEQAQRSGITGNPGGSSVSGSGSGGGTQLGIQETLAKEAAQNAYNAAQAMRTFQREQAARQLTDALGTIDRASIEGYKGIGNDYAARGLSKSGGYLNIESMAMADKTRADAQANQSVQDFLDQLNLQGTADLKSLGTTQQQILADFAARRFAGLGG
jgi:hypothetical protein